MSSSYAAAAAGTGDLWNSGRITSGASQNVAYRGRALTTSARYWFTVRTWDGTGAVSPWATPSTFGTGPGAVWSGAQPIWSQTPTNSWGDYSVSGTATIGTSAATIVFRSHDPANYYFWQFVSGGDRLIARVHAKGVDRTLGVVALAPLGVTLKPGAAHPFTITAFGSTITTVIDGVTVDRRPDATISRGFIGFRAAKGETSSFSRLAVSTRGGSSLWKQSAASTVSDFSCAQARGGILRVLAGTSCTYDPWHDYDLRLNYTATAQPTGVTFRAKDSKNYYLWQFAPATATLVPQQNVGGHFSALTSAKIRLGEKIVTGKTYSIRIVVQGSTIRTWFHGRLVDTRKSARFTTGAFGFRNGGKETSRFTSMSVHSLSGAMVYSNGFEKTSIDVPCGTVAKHAVTIGKSAACLIRSGAVSDWLFTRGQVDLPDKAIAWASVYATGSSPKPTRQYVYKLYVNGQYVGMGPTQSIGSELRYDGYDVTSLLKAGQSNALGALLYTTKDHRFIAKLVVHFTDGTSQIFGTGSSWTTLPGLATFPTVGSIGTSYYTAPKENIDSSHYPFGFATPSFDDRAWDTAQTAPRFASLRATPFAKVVQRYPTPTKITRLRDGDYVVDFGRTWAGGVRLTLPSGHARVVGIEYGEMLDKTTKEPTVQSNLSTGNRYRDEWTFAGGTKTMESWGLRVFRYVEIENSPVPITAKNLQAAAELSPFDEDAATFTSSDSTLNAVWALSRNTMEANTVNLYVDSWTRERGAYEADAYIQQREGAVLGSDRQLGIYTMDYLLAHPSWPTEWRLYDILSVHDAWQRSGDLSQARRSYTTLKTILLTKYLDKKTGLIKHPSSKDIVDWPAGERDGYRMTDYDTVVNVLTYRDLADMAALAHALGQTNDAATYTRQAAALKTAVNARLFDRATGSYRDGLETATARPIAHHAIQASAFALAFGLVDPANQPRVVAALKAKGMACSVYCAAFLLPGLYSAGAGDVANALLTSTGTRSWVNMIKVGAGSTMEAWDASLKSNTTYSHPWAASPTYDVAEGLLGVLPTAAGYSTFDVRPQPGAIASAAVTVPTVRGSIGASYHRVAGNRVDAAVQVPSTTAARVILPAAGSSKTVYVDGVARQGVRSGSTVAVSGLPSGCHVLSTQAGGAAERDQLLLGTCTTPYRSGGAS